MYIRARRRERKNPKGQWWGGVCQEAHCSVHRPGKARSFRESKKCGAATKAHTQMLGRRIFSERRSAAQRSPEDSGIRVIEQLAGITA